MSLRMGMLLMLMVVPAGCGVGEGDGSTPPWAQPETPTAPAVSGHEVDQPSVEVIDPYQVTLETTRGNIVIDVHPEWAPRGAARFHELVQSGFYDDNRIFRVVPEFVVQFGMHGDPAVNAEWDGQPIRDDRVIESNKRGRVTFATSGPNARTTQVFINLKDNPNLDTMPGSFAPFGEVVEGMDIVEALNSEYGEAPSQRQSDIAERGNEFLDAEYPNLDSIRKATLVMSPPDAGGTAPQESPGKAAAADSPTTKKEMPAESPKQADPDKASSENADPDKESADKPAPEQDPGEKPSSETETAEDNSKEAAPEQESPEQDSPAKEPAVDPAGESATDTAEEAAKEAADDDAASEDDPQQPE